MYRGAVEKFPRKPGWTKAEFNAIMNKHISAYWICYFLPIWLDVSYEEVAAYSSMVVDIYALSLSTKWMCQRDAYSPKLIDVSDRLRC